MKKPLIAILLTFTFSISHAADSTSLSAENNVTAQNTSGGGMGGYLSPSTFEKTFSGATAYIPPGKAQSCVANPMTGGQSCGYTATFTGTVKVSSDGSMVNIAGQTSIGGDRYNRSINVNVPSARSKLQYEGNGAIVKPTVNGDVSVQFTNPSLGAAGGAGKLN